MHDGPSRGSPGAESFLFKAENFVGFDIPRGQDGEA